MKSERRHELKTNTLAKGLEGLPEAGRRYGSRALLALIGVLLVAVLVRFFVTRSQDAAREAAVGLDNARRLIDQMPTLAAVGVSQPDRAEAVAQQREQLVQNVADMVNTALDKSSDPKIRAAAFIARGDLNWQLANFPELPGAATRPALAPTQPREAFLKAAEEAYQTVVNNPGGAPPEAVVFARLGLGAVAENRQQWDEAQKHYQAINDNDTVPQPLRQLAADELSRLAEIRQPLVIAAPRTAPSSPEQTLEDLLRQSRVATQPATRSIMLEPFTQPSTAPSTAPATAPAATTAPATSPATSPATAPGAQP